MKKLVAISIMAAMLLAVVSVAAMANQTNWKYFFQASNAAGAGGGTALTAGTISAAYDSKDSNELAGDFTSKGVANAMSYNPTLVGGASPWYYSTDLRGSIGTTKSVNATQSWDILVWRMPQMPGTDMKLSWTVGTISGPSNNLPWDTIGGVDYTYSVKVISDPTGQNSNFEWTSEGWNTTATSFNPNPLSGASITWTGLGNVATDPATAKLQGDQDWAVANAVKVRFTAAPKAVVTPEPSSMLALASGIFGMAGFAIRRRK